MNHLPLELIHSHLLPFLSPLELARFRQTCRTMKNCVDRFLHSISLSHCLESYACPRCGGWICRHALDTYDEFFDVMCPFERQRRWDVIHQTIPSHSTRMALLCEECEYDEVEWEGAVSLPYRGDRVYTFWWEDEFVLLFLWEGDHHVQWNEFRCVK